MHDLVDKSKIRLFEVVTGALFGTALLSTLSCPEVFAAQPLQASASYNEQMESQAKKLNTGLVYWIELKRGGKVSHVTQKETFVSGDKIRFHIRSNIDGYAYVVLKSGSQGDSSVLFPIANGKDNNRVTHGKDIVIPADDVLEFDAHPGVEHVCLTLSRQPINAKSLIDDNGSQEKVVMKAESGSKDLVPAKIKVAYTAPPEPDKTDKSDEHGAAKSDHKYAPAGISYMPFKHSAGNSGDGGGAVNTSTDLSAGEVTVVQEDPDGALNIDVDLNHAS